MAPVKLIVVFAACLAWLPANSSSTGHFLLTERGAASDLEIAGIAADIAPGTVRYISYGQLATLPQTTVTVTGDDNFRELPQQKLTVTGVYLDVLESSLGVLPGSDLLTALCSDGYRATYTREYMKTHRPILALKIDGLPVKTWAAQTHIDDPGPYFITHEDFTPSFSVLSFPELPKIPAKITRLEFGTTQQVYGAIAPHQKDASNPQVIDGFRIAQQHCYRCHNMGRYGGTKAGRSWQTLGNYAASSPSTFERYLRNPKSIDPKSAMSPNPQLDESTAKALQTYFQTFATIPH
ncbi:mono/diheme cytochrome c family protein [Edaphobacter lichenicola]|uniref:Mono/diheme cytochrome c family protein n=1 Tax=Tunturiibacter gelidiferens TaxID=3069689 RepID=A0ACC5P0X2_9BACT|nr:mono/diheme cytochrome c family protein [Edaphobacter lichenicola]